MLLINLGSKVNKCNPRCLHLGFSSSILCSTIFKILTVWNHVEVALQDFKVDHKKFIMLLCFKSEYKNRQTWNACNFSFLAMVVWFKKNLVLFNQEKKFYKPLKFYQNLKVWVAFHHFLAHLTWPLQTGLPTACFSLILQCTWIFKPNN